MEYGVIYIKICPKKGSPGEWIKYCRNLGSTPKSFQENVKKIANDINTKYSDSIIIPMDIMVHPGCTTTPESVEVISTDMYNQFNDLVERQGIPNSVRCVYWFKTHLARSLGPIGELSNINVGSTHHLPSDDVMIRVGRFLDSSDEPGLFKI
jgi:hypothetical protein